MHTANARPGSEGIGGMEILRSKTKERRESKLEDKVENGVKIKIRVEGSEGESREEKGWESRVKLRRRD